MNIPRHGIEWLVNRMHVGTPDQGVRDDIRRRCTNAAWTEDKIQEAEAHAIKVHRHNQKLYQRIMSGRI
jgi:hypothetical protein